MDVRRPFLAVQPPLSAPKPSAELVSAGASASRASGVWQDCNDELSDAANGIGQIHRDMSSLALCAARPPAQAQALAALPGAQAAIKRKRAEGAHFSYLTGEGQHAPAYRLSRTVARGSYTKVRTALDEAGCEWAMMVMSPHSQTPTKKPVMARTPLASILDTRRMLESIQSAMRPLDEWVDAQGKVYWRVPLKAMDVLQAVGGSAEAPLYTSSQHWREAFLYLFREMAASLVPVHRAGLVHFDVKPENWLLDTLETASVTLIDFGFAKPAGSFAPGRPRGTWRYMSPEVIFPGRGHKNIFDRSDIFSLGMAFVQMTNGKDVNRYVGHRPGVQATRAVRYRHIHQDLVRVQKGHFTLRSASTSRSCAIWKDTYDELAGIHPGLAHLVMNQMLDATPENRPDAQSVASAIGDMASSAAFDRGAKIMREQIQFMEKAQAEQSTAYFARQLRKAPARPVMPET